MKKVLLTIGFSFCVILTAFFISSAFDSLKFAPIAFPFILFLAAGAALGDIALWNELREMRSKKILISLCIWAGLFVILFLFLLFF